MTFNPVYNETFEFVGLSNEMFDRLNIVVTNQPSDGALSTVSRVTERLGARRRAESTHEEIAGR